MEKIDNGHEGGDPGIQYLSRLQDTGYLHHERACRAYAQWRVAYDEQQIAAFFKISVEEIQADLQYVQAMLPEEMVRLHGQEREEVGASFARAKKVASASPDSRILSAKELLGRHHNPGHVLRKLREESLSDIPRQVADLRQENIRASTNEPTIDLADRDARLIMELRERDRMPAKPIVTESQARHEDKFAPPGQNRQTTGGQEQKPRDSRTDRRITVRLDPDLHDKIRQYSQDAGIDLSTVIRRALRDFLEDAALSMAAKNNEMPQEALSLIGRYQTWGSDLREELWMQFLRTIAAAHTTSRRWHRDERSRRLSEGLIQLYHRLEGNDVRQK